MKKTNDTTLSQIYISGWLLIMLSFLIGWVSQRFGNPNREIPTFWFLQYGMSVLYLLTIWFGRRKYEPRFRLELGIFSFTLFWISAYGLNQFMTIFDDSVVWLQVLIVLIVLSIMCIPILNDLGKVFKMVIGFILGLGICLWCYQTLYLMPIMLFGAIGILALGIGIHAFVPLILLIMVSKWTYRQYKQDRFLYKNIITGVVVALIGVLSYVVIWGVMNHKMQQIQQRALYKNEQNLPVWVMMAQEMPQNIWTEHYVKCKLVYTARDAGDDFFEFSAPSRRYNEAKKHDPLIAIATFVFPQTVLNENERIQLLKACFEERNKAEDHLWLGNHLETTHVITHISMWPQYRMSYTEKTITVADQAVQQTETFRRPQEAIYNFQLPEGAAVTTLSLWIDGVESKGVLTTKQKADSAYRTIVGVESRDPSLVHWQEGNRVVVRVFPIQSGNFRVFKIGVVSPLLFHNNHLTYNNITMEGPSAQSAQEIVNVHWKGGESPKVLSSSYKNLGNQEYETKRNYIDKWEWTWAAEPLEEGSFNKDDNSYSLSPWQPEQVSVNFSKIIVDVNKTWTYEEYRKIVEQIGTRIPIWLYNNGWKQVNQQNAKVLFNGLHSMQFNLLPLQNQPTDAPILVITKGGALAPNLSDIETSDYTTSLLKWLSKDPQLFVYNLNATLSPIYKTIKEHRALQYEQGDVIHLQSLLSKKVFPIVIENDTMVVLQSSKTVIAKQAPVVDSSMPDYAMRLYAYHNIMRAMRLGIGKQKEESDTLVQLAKEAHIVSPISSLVVLESQKDYDRFGIKEAENSLKNASINNTGAVPEPGEWAMIIMGILGLLFYVWKIKKS
jgi:XrtN system VIT domain protein